MRRFEDLNTRWRIFLFFLKIFYFFVFSFPKLWSRIWRLQFAGKYIFYTTLRAIVKSFPISMIHFLDSPRSCIPGRASFNVTLTEGTQAGMFRYLGKNFNISECIYHACALGYGDYVYMIEDICFVVECYPEKKCDLKNSPESTDIAVRLKWSGKLVTEKQLNASKITSAHFRLIQLRSQRLPYFWSAAKVCFTFNFSNIQQHIFNC